MNRALIQGREEGINGALVMFLYTMRDKFGATDEQLTEFSDAFNYVVDSINRGYITEADLRNVVKQEYGTIIK